MNQQSKFDTETLMAFVDGELDSAQANEVELAMQTDAQLAKQITQQRELRNRLRNSFNAQLSEPLNERLLNTLRAAPATTANQVVDLNQARQRKTVIPTSHWHVREWSAMAASLIVGILVGVYVMNLNGNDLLATRNGNLIAQGSLASSLTTQLASTASAGHAIKIGISFRNHAGQYCRSFNVQNGGALAGFACRSHGDWRVQTLTESSANSTDEFRQAGSTTPSIVLSMIDQQIEGEPLDADAETRAQKSGWQ